MYDVKLKTFVILFALIAARSATAETCLFTYEDSVVFKGPCHFESGTDGSFSIYDARGWKPTGTGEYVYKNKRYAFSANLNVESPGTGRGLANLDFAQDDPRTVYPAARYHANLGIMRRYGACWLSESSAICAWK